MYKDILRVVAISDTHCKHSNLRIPRGDVLVHAGDVSTRGRREEVVSFLKWFSAQRFEHKIFIAGNHDFLFEKERPDRIQELIPPGITYLNDSGIQINGINIWGSPVTPSFYNWAFNRQRGPAIRKHWEMIPPGTDLLITHGPVYGFLDITATEQHVGCQDLLRTVLLIKPKVHLCGHIHEAYGMIKRSGIRFYNACMVNDQYDLVNQPIVFDL